MQQIAKIYKRLPSDERHDWYDRFRRYYLSHQSDYPSLKGKASSDMQRTFSEWIDYQTETQQRRFPYPKTMVVSKEFGQLASEFLKEMFSMRKDYLVEKHPEVLI